MYCSWLCRTQSQDHATERCSSISLNAEKKSPSDDLMKTHEQHPGPHNCIAGEIPRAQGVLGQEMHDIAKQNPTLQLILL